MSIVDTPDRIPAVQILGSRVHMVNMEESLDLIEGWIDEELGDCRQVVATGFHGLWEAHKDDQLRQILNSAELWVPDGIAPVLLARNRGFPQASRVPGPDLMEGLLQRCDRPGMRSFFLGDTADTLQALQEQIRHRCPWNQVVGALAPPFRDLSTAETDDILQQINDSGADVLWVAMGAPKQERWIYEHKSRLQTKVAIGVGAAFRFFSGRTQRAPAWLGNLGLEWAYRLFREPRKCWRRSLVEGPQFIFHAALEAAGHSSVRRVRTRNGRGNRI